DDEPLLDDLVRLEEAVLAVEPGGGRRARIAGRLRELLERIDAPEDAAEIGAASDDEIFRMIDAGL
ncbi:hypothetical protein, partial [Actinomadura sp. CNU-125]|uniref:hypothetical protein n=1 Tax=Actinomadura sp. CNU-125 TaxID=1904961 RepID=UPI001301949B